MFQPRYHSPRFFIPQPRSWISQSLFSLSSFPPLPQAYPPRTPLNISPLAFGWLSISSSHFPFCLVRISISRFPRPLTLSPFLHPLLLYYSYALSSSSSATSLVYFFLSSVIFILPVPFLSCFLSRLLMICFHAVFDTYDFVTSFLIWLH